MNKNAKSIALATVFAIFFSISSQASGMEEQDTGEGNTTTCLQLIEQDDAQKLQKITAWALNVEEPIHILTEARALKLRDNAFIGKDSFEFKARGIIDQCGKYVRTELREFLEVEDLLDLFLPCTWFDQAYYISYLSHDNDEDDTWWLEKWLESPSMHPYVTRPPYETADLRMRLLLSIKPWHQLLGCWFETVCLRELTPACTKHRPYLPRVAECQQCYELAHSPNLRIGEAWAIEEVWYRLRGHSVKQYMGLHDYIRFKIGIYKQITGTLHPHHELYTHMLRK